ncbi:tRNA-guanine transglycosylase [Cantharellus anzutake]|uniref:tRNA-guanine transglycosylase n=1 Tax=Cantharellus anzutake TaxID=1750568 RepID=UPI001905E1C4|nr:tRNA-guanine transglycosylase [Cantharellus anzutake]KAF8326671.1 tRNA-guanine transglycosylase [Cantharellus anzutake]
MQFEILAKCSTTRARVSRMTLAHGPTMLPTFMPVATQAALKGLTPQQVEELGITLMLNNTYHLNLRPGTKVLDAAGGAHKFQNWRRNLLTDSGGFQMVSLSSFSKVTEEGVLFASPFTGEPTMLTPEESIRIQHSVGADIIMQLDDVVSSLTVGPRVEEAMLRSIRWLDRCIAYHTATDSPKTQNLFAIVQGGLDHDLRDRCLDEMIRRKDNISGYAVGGLSGGEEKDIFWRIIAQCTAKLPGDRPLYSMGIGFAEDLLVCVALGIDMADCVFPTRTARFGVALTFDGPLNLKLTRHAKSFIPIDEDCPCPTCRNRVSRAQLHHLASHDTVGAHALTQHNVVFQARLMAGARKAIYSDTFPNFIRSFFSRYFGGPDDGYPKWCVDALKSVGIDLLEGEEGATRRVVEGDGAKWEYSDGVV